MTVDGSTPPVGGLAPFTRRFATSTGRVHIAWWMRAHTDEGHGRHGTPRPGDYVTVWSPCGMLTATETVRRGRWLPDTALVTCLICARRQHRPDFHEPTTMPLGVDDRASYGNRVNAAIPPADLTDDDEARPTDDELTAIALVEAWLDQRVEDAMALYTAHEDDDADPYDLISALSALAARFVQLAAGLQLDVDDIKHPAITGRAHELLASYRHVALNPDGH